MPAYGAYKKKAYPLADPVNETLTPVIIPGPEYCGNENSKRALLALLR